MQIGSKAVDLFTLFSNVADDMSDEQVLSFVDKIGNDYGSIISYLIGFDKQFRLWFKQTFKNKNMLSFSSLFQILLI